jgi:hypothetical protein
VVYTGYWPFLSYTYYIGKLLETSEYFPYLDLGVHISLGYFISGLGFLELWDFLPGLLVQILGTFAYLVNIGIWTSFCPNFSFMAFVTGLGVQI